MVRFNFIIYFFVVLFFYSCQPENVQSESIESEKIEEEVEIDRFTRLRFEYYKDAEKAIEENNDSLFLDVADWFLIYSKDPMSFVSYANRMALINNSKYGYYYYFELHDSNVIIEPTDTALVNHLFWYLAKSFELGMIKAVHPYSNKVLNQEIKDPDYYLKRM